MSSGVSRLTPISLSLASSEASRSEAPSLHRHCPASTVLWASPTPGSATASRGDEGRGPSPGRVSHVSQMAFPPCRSHYPGGPRRVHLSAASPSRFGLPRYSGGSAPTTSLSRPAQDSLALRPAELLKGPPPSFVPRLRRGELLRSVARQLWS